MSWSLAQEPVRLVGSRAVVSVAEVASDRSCPRFDGSLGNDVAACCCCCCCLCCLEEFGDALLCSVNEWPLGWVDRRCNDDDDDGASDEEEDECESGVL